MIWHRSSFSHVPPHPDLLPPGEGTAVVCGSVSFVPQTPFIQNCILKDNILFGSEMVGAVRGIDPETGQYFDDTKRYLDALKLTESDRYKIFEGNARRIFPRLKAGRLTG